MKSYYDYMQDYANVAEQGRKEGKTFIVKPEIYIGMNFLEDNGITEPWKPEAVTKLKQVIARYEEIEQKKFLHVLEVLFDMFTKN